MVGRLTAAVGMAWVVRLGGSTCERRINGDAVTAPVKLKLWLPTVFSSAVITSIVTVRGFGFSTP